MPGANEANESLGNSFAKERCVKPPAKATVMAIPSRPTLRVIGVRNIWLRASVDILFRYKYLVFSSAALGYLSQSEVDSHFPGSAYGFYWISPLMNTVSVWGRPHFRVI